MMPGGRARTCSSHGAAGDSRRPYVERGLLLSVLMTAVAKKQAPVPVTQSSTQFRAIPRPNTNEQTNYDVGASEGADHRRERPAARGRIADAFEHRSAGQRHRGEHACARASFVGASADSVQPRVDAAFGAAPSTRVFTASATVVDSASPAGLGDADLFRAAFDECGRKGARGDRRARAARVGPGRPRACAALRSHVRSARVRSSSTRTTWRGPRSASSRLGATRRTVSWALSALVEDDFLASTVICNGKPLTMPIDGELPRLAPDRLRAMGAAKSVMAAPVTVGTEVRAMIELVDASGASVTIGAAVDYGRPRSSVAISKRRRSSSPRRTRPRPRPASPPAPRRARTRTRRAVVGCGRCGTWPCSAASTWGGTTSFP